MTYGTRSFIAKGSLIICTLGRINPNARIDTHFNKVCSNIARLKKINLWLTAPKGATPVN